MIPMSMAIDRQPMFYNVIFVFNINSHTRGGWALHLRDCFLSSVLNSRESSRRGSRSTLVYRLGPLPRRHLLEHVSSSSKTTLGSLPGHNNVPGNDVYFATMMVLYSILVFMEVTTSRPVDLHAITLCFVVLPGPTKTYILTM